MFRTRVVLRLFGVLLFAACLVLATATPAVAAMVELKGVGSQEVVGPFYLPGGLTLFEWTMIWDRTSGVDFNVVLVDSGGSKIGGPLAQDPACEDCSGSAVIEAWYKEQVTPGDYFFRVRAGGPWTLRIGQFTGPTVGGQSFSGTGTRVVGPFSLPGGVTTFNWSQTSTPPEEWVSKEFFVNMVDINGVLMADRLVWRNDTESAGSIVVQPNEFAPYYGRVLPGLYLLNVHAVGPWTMSLESKPYTTSATSITIKTTATSTSIGKTPILSGAVTPNTMRGVNIVVYVKKPGKAYWTYSSNRTAYALRDGTAWQYKYYFKNGMTKGVYYFKASAPAPGFASSAGFARSESSVISIRLK